MNKHDEIIECPKSGGDLCYKIEVTKDITASVLILTS